jgi:tripartite-type tricarboxylate transporter receptor subunit TctC
MLHFSFVSRCGAVLLAAVAFLSGRTAMAQSNLPADFPMRPITLISPLAPGGAVDLIARLLTQEYQAVSGRPATLENRSGGAGNIGIDAVRRAAADGTTLLIVPAGNLTINPMLFPNLRLDVEKDFAPIAMLATTPNVFVAGATIGIKGIRELIDKAKQITMTYGTPGLASQLHLAMELFKQKTGAEITHVPYRGMPPALTDLLGGHIDILVSNLPVILPALKEKKAIPLALTSAERTPFAPDIPTLVEEGIPDIDVTSWYGLLAPRATPKTVLDAIFAVTNGILSSAEAQQKLKAQGLTVKIEAADLFADRIRRETAMWRDLIKDRNIKAN